jgi:hypothetical protein
MKEATITQYRVTQRTADHQFTDSTLWNGWTINCLISYKKAYPAVWSENPITGTRTITWTKPNGEYTAIDVRPRQVKVVYSY